MFDSNPRRINLALQGGAHGAFTWGVLDMLRHPGTLRTVVAIEMRMFDHAGEFTSPAWLTPGRLERRLWQMHFHMTDASTVPSLQRSDTKRLAYGPFLVLLREQNCTCADQWLAKEYHAVGRCASIDLKALFG